MPDWKPKLVRVWSARTGQFRWAVTFDPPTKGGFSSSYYQEHMIQYRHACRYCALLNAKPTCSIPT